MDGWTNITHHILIWIMKIMTTATMMMMMMVMIMTMMMTIIIIIIIIHIIFIITIIILFIDFAFHKMSKCFSNPYSPTSTKFLSVISTQ